jgi:hypothetical protein
MLVPLIVLEAVFELYHADKILDPGAKTLTQVPWLLKDDSASWLVVEPTVITAGSDAGEELQALALSFPAATTTTTPAATALAAAAFRVADLSPPKLMFMTQRLSVLDLQ